MSINGFILSLISKWKNYVRGNKKGLHMPALQPNEKQILLITSLSALT